MLFFPDVAFLNRIAINFVFLIIVMAVITALRPLKVPKVLPVKVGFDMRTPPLLKWLCGLVVLATIVLYIIFW
jgi:SSS family solute:Na+ symporter